MANSHSTTKATRIGLHGCLEGFAVSGMGFRWKQDGHRHARPRPIGLDPHLAPKVTPAFLHASDTDAYCS